jgi:hypothetical protein
MPMALSITERLAGFAGPEVGGEQGVSVDRSSPGFVAVGFNPVVVAAVG